MRSKKNQSKFNARRRHGGIPFSRPVSPRIALRLHRQAGERWMMAPTEGLGLEWLALQGRAQVSMLEVETK